MFKPWSKGSLLSIHICIIYARSHTIRITHSIQKSQAVTIPFLFQKPESRKTISILVFMKKAIFNGHARIS